MDLFNKKMKNILFIILLFSINVYSIDFKVDVLRNESFDTTCYLNLSEEIDSEDYYILEQWNYIYTWDNIFDNYSYNITNIESGEFGSTFLNLTLECGEMFGCNVSIYNESNMETYLANSYILNNCTTTTTSTTTIIIPSTTLFNLPNSNIISKSLEVINGGGESIQDLSGEIKSGGNITSERVEEDASGIIDLLPLLFIFFIGASLYMYKTK